jgi:hypothetical protein
MSGPFIDVREIAALLDEMRDFLDTYIDVVDGDDGQPRPNRAMSLDAEIARVLTRVSRNRQPQ